MLRRGGSERLSSSLLYLFGMLQLDNTTRTRKQVKQAQPAKNGPFACTQGTLKTQWQDCSGCDLALVFHYRRGSPDKRKESRYRYSIALVSPSFCPQPLSACFIHAALISPGQTYRCISVEYTINAYSLLRWTMSMTTTFARVHRDCSSSHSCMRNAASILS